MAAIGVSKIIFIIFREPLNGDEFDNKCFIEHESFSQKTTTNSEFYPISNEHGALFSSKFCAFFLCENYLMLDY